MLWVIPPAILLVGFVAALAGVGRLDVERLALRVSVQQLRVLSEELGTLDEEVQALRRRLASLRRS